jgi:hypothetical protein
MSTRSRGLLTFGWFRLLLGVLRTKRRGCVIDPLDPNRNKASLDFERPDVSASGVRVVCVVFFTTKPLL